MATIGPASIWKDVEAIRTSAPLIHNITNYVVMNSTANALLAIGAAPVMAHAEEEVEEMAGIADALVINIGTLSPEWVESMSLAMKRATKRGIPVVFDPVGVGATDYRTRTARYLIGLAPPTIIRGNASEIMALGRANTRTKGVDSTAPSDSAIDSAITLNRATGSVVCVSGEIDYIISATETASVSNGHPMMPRVTGLGCTATALCGAFAAVNPNPVSATVHAMVVMGIAGEMAAEDSAGPGSLQLRFIDALYSLTASDLEQRCNRAL